jgi:acetoacetate decarboxylase
MTIDSPSFSMPLSAPFYDRPPYLYRGGRVLICVYRTRRQLLDQLVPAPLIPSDENLVYAWVNNFPTINWGTYHEAIISVPVNLNGRKGQYIAYIYLDSDAPIAAGREIWGFPKKMSRVCFSDEGELLRGCVERKGIEIMRVSVAKTKLAQIDALSGLGDPLYNTKLIPSVEESKPPAVWQLTATTLQNVKVRMVVQGHAAIEYQPSPSDPLYLIEPIETIGGYYCELDFDLGYGEVVHDYLKHP